MRTKPTNRYNHPNQHAQFGIYNWFKGKGINDIDVIKEVVYLFCEQSGYDMACINKETKTFNYVQNRFLKFASFAVPYLKENNYL